MKMSPDQNDRSKWLHELTINVVTIDRFSQAADTGELFLTLPEQKESLRQKFLSLFTKKAIT